MELSTKKLVQPNIDQADLCHLTILPEHFTSQHSDEQFRVMLHDPIHYKLYSYIVSKGGQVSQKLVKENIAQVIPQYGSYIGSTTDGEIIQISFEGIGGLVGYKRKGLERLGDEWWEKLKDIHNSSSRDAIPLYGVYLNSSKFNTVNLYADHVRAYYIPRFKRFVVLDPQESQNKSFKFLKTLDDGSGSLFKTEENKYDSCG